MKSQKVKAKHRDTFAEEWRLKVYSSKIIWSRQERSSNKELFSCVCFAGIWIGSGLPFSLYKIIKFKRGEESIMKQVFNELEFKAQAEKVINNFEFNTQFEKDLAIRNFLLGDVSRFIQRLELINFVDLPSFLDIGCGYGQWAIAASLLNESVVAIDPDPSRIDFCQKLSQELGIDNIDFRVGNSEDLVGLESFDAVFLFGVLSLVSWKVELDKVISLLNDNGKLYFNANDYGYMIFNLIENPNVSDTFSGREWAIDCLKNTEIFNAHGEFNPSNTREGLVLPKIAVIEYLEKYHGRIDAVAGDGMIDLSGRNRTLPFFPEKFYGADGVYEVIFSLKGNSH
jgi:SAM-dependent methyltransferase